MDGQFLIRQIYEDEITYNLITAAVEILSEFNCVYNFPGHFGRTFSLPMPHRQAYCGCVRWMGSMALYISYFFFFRYLVVSCSFYFFFLFNIQKFQPTTSSNCLAKHFSIFVKIPVTIKYYKCSVQRHVISYRFVVYTRILRKYSILLCMPATSVARSLHRK